MFSPKEECDYLPNTITFILLKSYSLTATHFYDNYEGETTN